MKKSPECKLPKVKELFPVELDRLRLLAKRRALIRELKEQTYENKIKLESLIEGGCSQRSIDKDWERKKLALEFTLENTLKKLEVLTPWVQELEVEIQDLLAKISRGLYPTEIILDDLSEWP